MIRYATHNDIPALTALVLGFFSNGELDGTGLECDQDTIEFFVQDNIDLDDRAVMVAEINGEIIGAIAGGVTPWMFNADILTLMELGWFIPKANRGKYPMAALALRKKFHQWGRDKGATVLIMVSTKREESERVMRMYEKSGLKHIDSNYVGRL